MTPKFIYLETYGCSANLNNSEIIKGLIKQAGLELTNNEKIADILIINTCIVKEPTEKKIEERIKSLQSLNKPIILTGCMPDVRAKSLQTKNLYLLSNKNIKQINNLILAIERNNYHQEKFLIQKPEIKLNLPKQNELKKIGITQILEGCLGNCSFCITKLAKGKLFSYPQDKILENIEQDLANGCKEIWITSQDNSAYNLDNNQRKLPELLNKILNLKGKFRVRLGMMNPNNILPIINELIDCYKNKKMYKLLHIPLQSASNKILKSMNREYKVEDFQEIVKKFKSEIPKVSIATDIITGYPGETEKDYLASFNLIKEIQPDTLNVNKFWPMKPTPASFLPQIDKKIAKERASKLMDLYHKIIKEKNQKLVNSEQEVLVYDSFNNNYLTRTPEYKLVLLKSEKNILGKIVKVKIIKPERNHLVGEPV